MRLRPIRPEDEPAIVKFHQTLSEQSVHRAYFLSVGLASRTSHERLSRICFIDYDREMALVAELSGAAGEPESLVGVGQLLKDSSARRAEVAIIVTDRFQRRGIGRLLLEGLLRVATDEQLETLTAEVLQENYPMEDLLGKYGFKFQDRHDGTMTGRKQLTAVPDAPVVSGKQRITH